MIEERGEMLGGRGVEKQVQMPLAVPLMTLAAGETVTRIEPRGCAPGSIARDARICTHWPHSWEELGATSSVAVPRAGRA